jgi:hypothetical protein
MSLLNLRRDSYDLPSNGSLMLEIMTALLITFAAALALVCLAAALGGTPATDLDFLAIAYS